MLFILLINKSDRYYLFLQVTLCRVVKFEMWFLHHPLRTNKPAMNKAMLTITDHINTSELLRKVFVKESLNKTTEATKSITPIAIGCLREK